MSASIVILVALSIFSVAAATGSIVITLRDGYRRIPTNR